MGLIVIACAAYYLSGGMPNFESKGEKQARYALSEALQKKEAEAEKLSKPASRLPMRADKFGDQMGRVTGGDWFVKGKNLPSPSQLHELATGAAAKSGAVGEEISEFARTFEDGFYSGYNDVASHALKYQR